MSAELNVPGVQTCTEDTPSGATCSARVNDAVILYEDYRACYDSPILLPGFGVLPVWFQAIVYFLALAYLFFGVAILADAFMAAVESMTAQVKTVKRKDGPPMQVPVWNPTVANLTLLALGSSAPEIILSIIDTITRLGRTGRVLGSATILGSASFNLLVIPAVCTLSLPAGQSRRVSYHGVFLVTAVFALWAYLWTYICLEVWTPEAVTIQEAVITLLQLPLLVVIAWRLDLFERNRARASDKSSDGDRDSDQQPSASKQDSIANGGSEAAPPSAPPLAQQKSALRASHARLGNGSLGASVRFAASGNSSARSQAETSDSESPHPVVASASGISRATGSNPGSDGGALGTESASHSNWPSNFTCGSMQTDGHGDLAVAPSIDSRSRQVRHDARSALTGRIGFSAVEQRVRAQGAAARVWWARTNVVTTEESKLAVAHMVIQRRTGHEQEAVRVRVRSKDGTAVGGEEEREGVDYVHVDTELTFAPMENTKAVEVQVHDDEEVEETEHFFLELLEPEGSSSRLHIADPTCKITILDSSSPGVLALSQRSLLATAEARVPVVRLHGSCGEATVSYTAQMTSAPSAHHEEPQIEGTLHFASRCEHRDIVFPVRASAHGGGGPTYRVALTASTGAEVLKRKRVCTVTVTDAKGLDYVQKHSKRFGGAPIARFASTDWGHQFFAAFEPNADADSDGDSDGDSDDPSGALAAVDAGGAAPAPSASTYILHYISITWKLIAAFVPPPGLGAGLPAFLVSLLLLGLTTYLIQEFAILFGCAVGFSDAVTAITYVALGTSLPDTFASRHACISDDDADGSLTNITGSNAVNVYLGLGIPWLIAASYYKARGETFAVSSTGIAFALVLYLCTAAAQLTLLTLNRYFGSPRGELGGSGALQRYVVPAFMVAMWLLYVVLASLDADRGGMFL